MFYYYYLLITVSLFPSPILYFPHSISIFLFQLTHPFLSFPHSLSAHQLSSSIQLTPSSPPPPTQPSADSASLSLSPSLSPPPLALCLPPPTDDSNGRSGDSNGRPDDSKSGGNSGNKLGGRSGSVGHFTWVFRWVWFGLGCPVGLDCFWVGFLGEFWLILSWVFQWVCLDFELDFLIAFLLILGYFFVLGYGVWWWHWVWEFDGYFLLPSYFATLVCCSLIEERGKKRIKKSFTRWTVIVHICTVTIHLHGHGAYLHIVTKIDVVVFSVRMCKIGIFFCILEDYRWADVVALNLEVMIFFIMNYSILLFPFFFFGIIWWCFDYNLLHYYWF